MRPLGLVGIALAVIGIVVVVRGLSVTTNREVLRVGDMQVTAAETRSVPMWAGATLIAVGAILVGASVRRKGA
jgi:hypothetical protein